MFICALSVSVTSLSVLVSTLSGGAACLSAASVRFPVQRRRRCAAAGPAWRPGSKHRPASDGIDHRPRGGSHTAAQTVPGPVSRLAAAAAPAGGG